MGRALQTYDLCSLSVVRYPALTEAFELMGEGVAIGVGLEATGVLFSRAMGISFIVGDIAVATDTLGTG